MKNFKNALKLLIDNELKDNNDIKTNVENLESLKNLLNKSIDFKIEKLKEEELKNTLKEYLESYKPALTEGDESYSLEKQYTLPTGLDKFYIDTLSKINVDYNNMYCGEKPKNIPKEFEYIFNQCKGYENDTFYVRPYNSYGLEHKDCSCGLENYLNETYYNLPKEELEKFENDNIYKNFHSKECNRHTIYFYYKPTNLKIEYIKRPLYGAVANQEITKEIFEAILMDCVNSYNKDFAKEGESISE